MTGFWEGRVYRGDKSDEDVSGREKNETLLGAGGDDFLSEAFVSGDDLIRGGAGDDYLIGGLGSDTLEGGTGDDRVSVLLDRGLDLIDLGGGLDELTFDGESRTITGGLVMTVRSGVVLVTAGSEDVLHATGAERVNAYDGPADDRLSFGAGDDLALISGGADNVNGAGGDDFILVQGHDDSKDVVEGGTGDDILAFEANASSAISVDVVADGLNIVRNGKTILEATGVEVFQLAGSNRNDALKGLDGDDFLTGRDGADRIDGGAGSDFASFESETGPVSIKLVAGKTVRATVDGEANDRLTSIENLQGGEFGDTLIGDRGDNVIRDDITVEGSFVDGGRGVDTFDFESFTFAAVEIDLETDDRISNFENLTGEAGLDTLRGDDGGNRLDSDGGLDVMTGRGGADVFAFTGLEQYQLIVGGDHKSTHAEITDFSKADIIDLSTLGLSAGMLAQDEPDWTYRGAKNFTGNEGELRFVEEKSSTYVLADLDGDKQADFAIKLDKGVKLTEDDFIL